MSFLDERQFYAACGNTTQPHEKGIDWIFDNVDAALCLGAFEDVDDFLKHVTLTRLAVYAALALTAAVYPARHELKAWELFYVRVAEYIKEVCPDRAERLLVGFQHHKKSSHDHGIR